MWASTLGLYFLPFAARFALEPFPPPWDDVFLSLLPTSVAAPTVFLPRVLRDPEREHVVRHALYAAAFAVAGAAAVRWDEVDWDASWGRALAGYVVLGTLALAWFCVAHLMENAGTFEVMHTHHGDIVILPLVLVAVGTFANDVPQEVFRFSRSVIYFTPIVVAWATLNFLAFCGFATSRTTTHESPGFSHLAFASLIVASTQLLLLELRAPALAHVGFAVVAALLYQRMPRPSAFPLPVRAGRAAGTLLVATGLGLAVSELLSLKWGRRAAVYVPPAVALVLAAFAFPHVAGDRWPLPAIGYASLGCLAVFDAFGLPLAPFDVAATFGAFTWAAFACEALTPALRYPHPRDAIPSASTRDRPQDALPWWSWSKLASGGGVPCVGGRRYNADTARAIARRRPNRAPPAFDGVWWMEGNPFPITLLTLQRARWRSDEEATAWMGFVFTREATLASVLLLLAQLLVRVELRVEEDGWVRTDASLPLGLLHATYWAYRVSADEYVRVAYDRRGREVWRYRMLRVATSDGAPTRFHQEFLRNEEGRAFWSGFLW